MLLRPRHIRMMRAGTQAVVEVLPARRGNGVIAVPEEILEVEVFARLPVDTVGAVVRRP